MKSLLSSESPPSEPAVTHSPSPDHELQHQTAYAIACMKQWGYQIPHHEQDGDEDQAPPASLVIASLIQQLNRLNHDNDTMRDKLLRSQSDARMLDVIRIRLEGELDDSKTKLATLKQKQIASEERWMSEVKRLKEEKEALSRQLKDSNQRQVQQQHTIRRQEGEYNQLQRHLRKSVSISASPSKGPGEQSPTRARDQRPDSLGVSEFKKTSAAGVEDDFANVQLRCSHWLSRPAVSERPPLSHHRHFLRPNQRMNDEEDAEESRSRLSGRKTWGVGSRLISPDLSPLGPSVLEILRRNSTLFEEEDVGQENHIDHI